MTFDPAMQTAHVGDVIQWSNTGSVMHTVTFDSEPSLSDPSLAPGGVWEVKLRQQARISTTAPSTRQWSAPSS
jgi:plastocyanin